MFVYPEVAQDTIEKIENGIESVTINRLYKHSNGFYWKINSRGYYHIIKPGEVWFRGKFSHFEIEDYMLTKDDMLKCTKQYGNYQTIEECIKDIEEEIVL